MNNETHDDFQWRQFAKLGDMMGDGLHLEPGGKWISKEYNALAQILIPEAFEKKNEIRKELRRHKNETVNAQMEALLQHKKCDCGGKLEQTRSGSKKVKCIICNKKYIAR